MHPMMLGRPPLYVCMVLRGLVDAGVKQREVGAHWKWGMQRSKDESEVKCGIKSV